MKLRARGVHRGAGGMATNLAPRRRRGPSARLLAANALDGCRLTPPSAAQGLTHRAATPPRNLACLRANSHEGSPFSFTPLFKGELPRGLALQFFFVLERAQKRTTMPAKKVRAAAAREGDARGVLLDACDAR